MELGNLLQQKCGRRSLLTAASALPFLGASVSGATAAPSTSEEFNLNTALMKATFKVQGQTKGFGTAFILGNPVSPDSTRVWPILVTADHVLRGVIGDTATLHLRTQSDDGGYIRFPVAVKIRDGERPLWVRHGEADVAAAYLSGRDLTRASMFPLPSAVLGGDDAFEKLQVQPGDELNSLGFPHGQEANSAGFPILRSGKIASYPLVPANKVKTFLYDFQVYGGNSGGPVYMWVDPKRYSAGMLGGPRIQFIAGLVSEERLFEEVHTKPYEVTVSRPPLYLAVVVPAQFIKETVDLLPSKPPSSRGSVGVLECTAR